MSHFDVMNHPFPIDYVEVTPGGRNQSTSVFTGQTNAAAVAITGNFDRLPLGNDVLVHQETGEIDIGEVTFFTEHPLKLNSTVIVYFDDAKTIKLPFTVKERVHDYAWLHAKLGEDRRTEWRLKVKEQPNG